MSARWLLMAGGLGLATAAATLGGPGPAFGIHDAVGSLVRGPQLPVVLVTIDTTAEQAASRAEQAGARSVQMALPAGHPLLGNAPPERRALRVDVDHRVRSTDGGRLRLPEALPSLRRMNEEQMADPGASRPLEGMAVVLVHGTDGMGRTVLVPGRDQPVDRGVALAIAEGSHASGQWLSALPPWGAALLTGLMATVLTIRSRRWTPTSAWWWTGGAVVFTLAATLLCRALGFDLPVGGMLLAAALPGPVRLVSASARTLEVLDGLSLRVGGLYRWTDENVGPVDGLPAMLAMSYPGVHVAAFRGGRDGSPELLAHAGPDSGATTLARVPPDANGTPLRHEEPIYEQGTLKGALVLTHPDGLPPGAIELARVAARRAAWQYGPGGSGEQDPVQARLNVLRRGVLHTVKTVSSWQALLSGGLQPIGIFDRSGDLVAGNRALREALGSGREAPMVAALRALLASEDSVRAVLGVLPSAEHPIIVSGRETGQSLRLSPLFTATGPAGVLLQLESERWEGAGAALDAAEGHTAATLPAAPQTDIDARTVEERQHIDDGEPPEGDGEQTGVDGEPPEDEHEPSQDDCAQPEDEEEHPEDDGDPTEDEEVKPKDDGEQPPIADVPVAPSGGESPDPKLPTATPPPGAD